MWIKEGKCFFQALAGHPFYPSASDHLALASPAPGQGRVLGNPCWDDGTRKLEFVLLIGQIGSIEISNLVEN